MAKKTKSKKNNNTEKLTYVALVVDRSGSMTGCRNETWQGLNEQIQTIKANAKLSGLTTVTINQFNGVFETIRDNVAADDIQQLDYNEYSPVGSTALYDAVGRTIAQLEGKKTTDDTGFLVIVISDGQENASQEWRSDTLKQKIEALEKTGKWTFTYMMANVSSTYAYQNMGAQVQNSAMFVATAAGTKHASRRMTGSYVNFASLRSSGVTSTSDFYAGDNNGGAASNIQLDVNNAESKGGNLTTTPANNLTATSPSISATQITFTKKSIDSLTGGSR